MAVGMQWGRGAVLWCTGRMSWQGRRARGRPACMPRADARRRAPEKRRPPKARGWGYNSGRPPRPKGGGGLRRAPPAQWRWARHACISLALPPHAGMSCVGVSGTQRPAPRGRGEGLRRAARGRQERCRSGGRARRRRRRPRQPGLGWERCARQSSVRAGPRKKGPEAYRGRWAAKAGTFKGARNRRARFLGASGPGKTPR
ncbi:MAG: hypothetical protein J3K34DRAFT_29109 [Monoraphidium minutum]|nr:MAG: hypothetical protein J3K34DRAFT_29109 [Monoraphidium minutum]